MGSKHLRFACASRPCMQRSSARLRYVALLSVVPCHQLPCLFWWPCTPPPAPHHTHSQPTTCTVLLSHGEAAAGRTAAAVQLCQKRLFPLTLHLRDRFVCDACVLCVLGLSHCSAAVPARLYCVDVVPVCLVLSCACRPAPGDMLTTYLPTLVPRVVWCWAAGCQLRVC